MATIKNEFDYIQEARSQLAEALVNKFGVREQDILNADGSIKSTGLWASNSDGSKNYLKRLHDWVTLVTATNVHTDASLTFKDNGEGDEVGTTFNGSVAKSISYNSIGAAPVGHTHTTKIETSTGTSQIKLAYGGKYKLTAGETTYVFTMPSSDNTWRPVGTGANDAAAGNHIHKNLIIKWGTGNTEGTDLFTYNGSTAKTIDLNIPISQLFTNFTNFEIGFNPTKIEATIGGTTRKFTVNWADYTGRAQTADRWTNGITLTIGSAGKSVNGSENVSWSLAEIGASDSLHTHRVQINGTTKAITAPGGTVVDLGSYLPLTGGTMTGAINLSNANAKLAFGNLTKSPIKEYKAPSLSTNGVGIYSCLGNTQDEGAIIITEDTCVIYNSADTGWNFQVMDTDLGKDMSQSSTRSFGVNSNHQAWSLGGFVKNGSSDNYVLLGGGGHKLVSDFATEDWVTNNYYNLQEMDENYYNASDIDSMLDNFLPKSGGTMTGPLTTKDIILTGTMFASSKSEPIVNFWTRANGNKEHNFGAGANIISLNSWFELTKDKLYYVGDIHTAKSLRIKDALLAFDPATNTLNISGASGQTAHLAVKGTIITPGNDTVVIKPAQDDYDSIGSADKRFYKIYSHFFYGNEYYSSSDIRYKNVIKHSCIDLSNLAALPIFLYTWKDKRDNTIHIGSSAQAVEQVIPQLVTENSTGFKSLNYSILGTVAGITACKELVTQKSELQQLKEKVKQLEDKLHKYENI